MIKVQLVRLGGFAEIECEAGTTVEEFRYKNDLGSNIKILDEEGNLLTNEQEITKDCTLYTSAPKKNA